jgi:transposase
MRNPDKAQLRTDILAMRADGMSYRQIARAVGLHWTRVQQIVKSAN